MINFINKKMTSHWQIRSIIEKIEDLKEKGQFYFVHCYREANTVADNMANWSLIGQDTSFFTNVVDLPTKVRTLLKMDKDQMTNFRVRTSKNRFNV